ncbi:MAG TPA: M48 family metallopeptidase [Frankiaceae bacterium]|jgi:STE24 endopeptidase|nr:M48 family metallopeptidase [Frankiaceae bacterium]
MSRTPALVAFLVLGGLLVVVIALTTPWSPLGAGAPHVPVDPARDFTPEQVAREVAFHRALRPAAYASLFLGLAVAGALGLTRTGARLVERVPGPWPVKAAGGALALALVPTLLTLPLSARAEVVLRRYDLSTRTWGGWLGDQARSALVGGVILVVATTGLVALARKAPATWWAWGGVGAAVLVALVSYVYPVAVEPLFNDFRPLAQEPLRSRLLDLAERDGIEVDDVLVADASRRTTALNAYVSGYGSTRRIVVYDTLLAKGSDDEVALVVAHELGHVKNDDVRNGTLVGALGAAAAVAGLFLLLTSPRVLARAGADGAGDPRVLGLVVFAIAATGFLTSPVQSLVSRRVEARADVHSIDLTGDLDAFVESEKTLAVTNLSDLDPHPLAYAWFASHPTSPERLALARARALQREERP